MRTLSNLLLTLCVYRCNYALAQKQSCTILYKKHYLKSLPYMLTITMKNVATNNKAQENSSKIGSGTGFINKNGLTLQMRML